MYTYTPFQVLAKCVNAYRLDPINHLSNPDAQRRQSFPSALYGMMIVHDRMREQAQVPQEHGRRDGRTGRLTDGRGPTLYALSYGEPHNHVTCQLHERGQ